MIYKPEIPHPPKINFIRDEESNNFKLKNIRIKIDDKEFEVVNLEFNISKIYVKFNFKEKEDENFLSDKKNFNINFENKNTEIFFSKFHKMSTITEEKIENRKTVYKISFILFFKELNIKNGIIDKSENVRVYKLINNLYFNQWDFKNLNFNNKNLYLLGKFSKNYRTEDIINKHLGKKSSNGLDSKKLKEVTKIINQLDHDRIDSLKPFDADGYFYFEDKYDSLKMQWKEIFDILTNLLRFYSASDFKFNVEIIEDQNENFECKCKLNDNVINYGNIFSNKETNLYNFLNSSYKKGKENKSKIEALSHYYPIFMQNKYPEVKILSESVFLEIFVSNWLVNNEKDNPSLFFKLNKALTRCCINKSILTKIFLPEIYEKFESLNKKFLKNESEDFEEYKVNKIFKTFKEEYFIESIVVFRNKIVHSGVLEYNNNFVEEILLRIYNRLKFKKKSKKRCLVEKIFQFLLLNFEDFDFILINQCWAFEAIVNLIFLVILKSNCELDKSSFLGEHEKYFISSTKGYVKQFLSN